MITRILLALIYVQNSITMPHLVVIQLMRVIKWPRSHSHGNCVNKKGRGYKGFYSILDEQRHVESLGCLLMESTVPDTFATILLLLSSMTTRDQEKRV